jgi:transmembrane sensor
MTDDPHVDDRVLERYLAGEATRPECRAIEQWLASDRSLVARIDRLRRPSRIVGRRDWATETEWARLRSRIGSGERPMPHRLPRRRNVRHGRDIRRAAALLLAAIGLGGGSTYWYRTAVVETFTVTTTRGERREVHARDGTMFTLGPASSLRYTARRNGRKSTLTGIADFVVVHDASRPFVVHTSNTITRDVGTEFSVRAYAGDARVIVAVSSGVVEVAAARRAGGGVTDGHVVLRAGDVAHVDETGTVEVEHATASEADGWRRGRLVFDNVSLAEAAADVGRWYDVDITIADSALSRRRVTAVHSHPSLDGVLAALGAAVDARVARVGRRVVIGGRP